MLSQLNLRNQLDRFYLDYYELILLLWLLIGFNCNVLITFVKNLLLQALFDLENTNHELKSDLKDLYINSAV